MRAAGIVACLIMAIFLAFLAFAVIAANLPIWRAGIFAAGGLAWVWVAVRLSRSRE
jgi:hypothetical protein